MRTDKKFKSKKPDWHRLPRKPRLIGRDNNRMGIKEIRFQIVQG